MILHDQRVADYATLEEFLEDLLLQSNSPEQIDLLLELLREVQQSHKRSVQTKTLLSVLQDENAGRFGVFEIAEGGILTIGFVTEVGNPRKILPGLYSVRNRAYFLYDTNWSKIIELFERSADRKSSSIA